MRAVFRAPTRFDRFEPRDWRTLAEYSSLFGLGCLVGWPISAALGFPVPEVFGLGAVLGAGFWALGVKKGPGPFFRVDPKAKDPQERRFLELGTDEFGWPLQVPLSELTRHVLLIGTTGAGKTTGIRKLLFSHMLWGGGCTFVDGKSDTRDTFYIFASMVAEAGRQEDFLVLNFLNPAQSNTFNPFLHGDGDFLVELLANFLPETSGDGNADYFKGRGLVLMRSVMAILVWMRDELGKVFDVRDVQRALSLKNVVEWGMKIKSGEIPLYVTRGGARVPVGERLMAYLSNLGPWEQVYAMYQGQQVDTMLIEQVVKQHQFAVQQWDEALDLLGGTYAPIFCTHEPEIDMVDVIQNSRILYVLLPSLEKSETTLQRMGKMILGVIKTALSTLLGRDVVGSADEITERVERNRPALSHIAVLDEYGSYAVPGFSTVLAQARSLGYAVIISVQDLGRLYRASEAEAGALIGNTNIKILMKIEDPEKTGKIVLERVGKSYMLVPSTVMAKKGVLPGYDVRAESFTVQERERIQLLDLYALKKGEAYFIYEDRIRKFRFRYEKGKKVKRLALLVWRKVAQGKEDEDLVVEVRGRKFLRLTRDVVLRVLDEIRARLKEDERNRSPFEAAFGRLVRVDEELVRGLLIRLGPTGTALLFGFDVGGGEPSRVLERELEEKVEDMYQKQFPLLEIYAPELIRPTDTYMELLEEIRRDPSEWPPEEDPLLEIAKRVGGAADSARAA
ncbi:TraM recognition domain-containing protein [Thermosulfurimonas sp. F29]|uniref:TraM recognition domain-containing protein n=1 Tax=Thermosulfurimonas sp. F29 TaxID=2867247 RepID=UPI001C840300|nr:TraM recognition domain-containing protein [Thermosulfurimonas sp. F29]MBX6424235.1 TraM recognition domain-containing protein [Thermosulfurimonas sp. F29]